MWPLRRQVDPQALDTRAMDNLRFIRETMERAASFTAVPGFGGAAMGVVALVAAALAARHEDARTWLLTWLAAATVAFAIGALAMLRKSRRAGVPMLHGAGRSFMRSLCPPLVAGAVLTAALYANGAEHLLPGTWLLLYGVGVVSAGAHSVRVVPLMGLCFMLAGAAALATPASWGNAFMAAGFGVLQIVFGAIIARRHGG
jgi:hypothetical protein